MSRSPATAELTDALPVLSGPGESRPRGWHRDLLPHPDVRLATRGLHLAATPLRAMESAASHAESLLDRSAQLVESLEHFSEHTRRQSLASVLSWRSVYSVLSWFSAGSILSVGSAASFGSVASAGSILSIGSTGSILSVGSVGSVGAIGGVGRWGRRSLVGPSGPTGDDPVRLIRQSATLLGVAALAAAVLRPR